MYLLDRQKKILTLLISGNGWITGEKIGSALGITDRTVRNDIRIINEELQEYTDSVIESIRGKGYFLVSKERNILLEKLEKTDVGETTEGRLYSKFKRNCAHALYVCNSIFNIREGNSTNDASVNALCPCSSSPV